MAVDCLQGIVFSQGTAIHLCEIPWPPQNSIFVENNHKSMFTQCLGEIQESSGGIGDAGGTDEVSEEAFAHVEKRRIRGDIPGLSCVRSLRNKERTY